MVHEHLPFRIIATHVFSYFFMLPNARFFASREARLKHYFNFGIIGVLILPRAVNFMLLSLPVEAEEVTSGL